MYLPSTYDTRRACGAKTIIMRTVDTVHNSLSAHLFQVHEVKEISVPVTAEHSTLWSAAEIL